MIVILQMLLVVGLIVFFAVLIILALPWIAKLMDRYLYWVDDIMGR